MCTDYGVKNSIWHCCKKSFRGEKNRLSKFRISSISQILSPSFLNSILVYLSNSHYFCSAFFSVCFLLVKMTQNSIKTITMLYFSFVQLVNVNFKAFFFFFLFLNFYFFPQREALKKRYCCSVWYGSEAANRAGAGAGGRPQGCRDELHGSGTLCCSCSPTSLPKPFIHFNFPGKVLKFEMLCFQCVPPSRALESLTGHSEKSSVQGPGKHCSGDMACALLRTEGYTCTYTRPIATAENQGQRIWNGSER